MRRRRVRLSEGATRQASQLDEVEGFTDALRALKWVLGRQPEEGIQLAHPILFLYRMETVNGWPDLRATYRYDHESVTIHAVAIVESESDP